MLTAAREGHKATPSAGSRYNRTGGVHKGDGEGSEPEPEGVQWPPTSNPYFVGDTDSDKECLMSKESHLRKWSSTFLML